MKFLGVDYGTVRTGIAVYDSEVRVALPFCILPTDDTLFDAIAQLISREHIDEVVIGFPYTLSGAPGSVADKVTALRVYLEQAGVRVGFEDERMTTALADRAELSTKDRRHTSPDAAAAAHIVESYATRHGY